MASAIMSERWKVLPLLLFQLFAVITASLHGDEPETVSNSLNGKDDVLSPKSFVFWPNGTIPFYINTSHFDHEQQVLIMTALTNFAFKTCLKFRPVLSPPQSFHHVLVFQNPEAFKQCYLVDNGHSRAGPHYVTLGYKCLLSPNIEMMLMRALGFPFEHNRIIRDLYIDVQTENIEAGHLELYTKDMKLPLELRSLPYDINSVTHFGEREFSKNGHRTIIIKNPNTVQRRRSLTNLDLRRIEIVYGPECLKRDREAKLKECIPYDGQLSKRRKREVEEPSTSPGQSLRVNPDITPPVTSSKPPSGELPEELSQRLKGLGIEDEVQEIVDKVSRISSKALTEAREHYCNKSENVEHKGSSKEVSLVDVLETVAAFAESLVSHAVLNLTLFCEVADPVTFYQRAWCQFNNPRCVQTYFKSTNFWRSPSTQYRPRIVQSTRHWDLRPPPHFRAQNDTEEKANETASSVADTSKARRKREAFTKEVDKDVVTPRYHVQSTPKSRRKYKFTGEPKEMYKNRENTDEEGWDEEVRVTAIHFEPDEVQADSDEDVPETKHFKRKKQKPERLSEKHVERQEIIKHHAQPKIIEYAAFDEDSPEPKKLKRHREVPLITGRPKIQISSENSDKYSQSVNVLKPKKKVNSDNNMEKKKEYIPKTVNLSKMNEEFYDARRWRDGVVRYIIADEGGKYDLADMRSRLEEVSQILKRKTCVRIQEITETEADRYEDYLVLDTSPDYVTGRVGGKQYFGSIELFAGGQHRQHAAMMVMAMLGFYFEVSRHDRDKYIVVHPRNIRPDKLHHFEMLRADATLSVPYDYKSATHPAWQFWRKIGKTGIATVATYKEMDPDGKIMKMLGQHKQLLSEIDIVKINSVYGTKCFTKRGKSTKRDRSQTNINF